MTLPSTLESWLAAFRFRPHKDKQPHVIYFYQQGVILVTAGGRELSLYQLRFGFFLWGGGGGGFFLEPQEGIMCGGKKRKIAVI